MTNQYIDQLPLTVRQAIFGNVGTLGSFVVSQADASILEKEFAPIVSSDDLVSLDAYALYVKLCIDGMTSVPFSARSLPIRYEKFDLRDEIVKLSREKYGTKKEEIEEKIMKWSSQTYSEKGNKSIGLKQQKVVEKEIVQKKDSNIGERNVKKPVRNVSKEEKVNTYSIRI